MMPDHREDVRIGGQALGDGDGILGLRSARLVLVSDLQASSVDAAVGVDVLHGQRRAERRRRVADDTDAEGSLPSAGGERAEQYDWYEGFRHEVPPPPR